METRRTKRVAELSDTITQLSVKLSELNEILTELNKYEMQSAKGNEAKLIVTTQRGDEVYQITQRLEDLKADYEVALVAMINGDDTDFVESAPVEVLNRAS